MNLVNMILVIIILVILKNIFLKDKENLSDIATSKNFWKIFEILVFCFIAFIVIPKIIPNFWKWFTNQKFYWTIHLALILTFILWRFYEETKEIADEPKKKDDHH